jgi:hypothetical protein
VIIVSKKHNRGEKGNKNIGNSIPSKNTVLSIDVFNTNSFNIIKIY